MSDNGHNGLDLLHWVGRQFYSTPEKYIEEARRLGCCRKMPTLPKLKLGETCVFLAFQKKGQKSSRVFAFYRVDGVIACAKQQEITDEIRNGIPITAIGAKARPQIPARGCGDIDPPSIYVVGRDITRDLGFRTGVLPDNSPRIHVLPEPIRIPFRHRKGFTYIEGDTLLTEHLVSYGGDL